MTTPFVSRHTAERHRTHHQFVPGLGYLEHEEAPDLPAAACGSANCSPAANTKDGSRHVLQPPGGHPAMVLIWVAAESAWAPLNPAKGNRMAWTPAHLSRAGWEYVGPENGAKGKRR